MGTRENKVGLSFGAWTVIAPSRKRTTDGKTYWLCRCACGTEREVNYVRLKRARSRSCGRCPAAEKTPPGTKTCSGCGETKPLSDFYTNRALEDGHTRKCKPCTYTRADKPLGRRTVLDVRPRKTYTLHADNESAAWAARVSAYEGGAASRGLSWEITAEAAVGMMRQDCFYCGTPPATPLAKTCPGVFRNGIDRQDNARGYEPGNVVACCVICNRAKLDMGYDDWVGWLSRIRNLDIPQKNPGLQGN